jgi:hypothetical protein
LTLKVIIFIALDICSFKFTDNFFISIAYCLVKQGISFPLKEKRKGQIIITTMLIGNSDAYPDKKDN